MRRPLTLVGLRAGLLAALLATAACAPNPILARDPVPAPSQGTGAVCGSSPLLFGFYDSTCRPVQSPQEPVVRARG